MNIESLWEQTCALLSRDMPYVSYNTWVEGNMVPGILEDDTMFITVKMDRMISMIQSKYADLIEKRLSEAAGRPLKIVLLGKDEMADCLHQVSLSKAHAAIDKQRVIGFARALGDSQRRSLRKAVGIAHHEAFKGIFGIQMGIVIIP